MWFSTFIFPFRLLCEKPGLEPFCTPTIINYNCIVISLFSKTVRQEAWEKSTKPFEWPSLVCCPVICLNKRILHSSFFTLHSDSRFSRKEVFQPHLPVRLPCYDLAPITGFTLGRSLRLRTSGAPGFHGLTGGVYKARERIHRAMADAPLLANPASWGRVADPSPNWDMF